jgi:hypothetical protein
MEKMVYRLKKYLEIYLLHIAQERLELFRDTRTRIGGR